MNSPWTIHPLTIAPGELPPDNSHLGQFLPRIINFRTIPARTIVPWSIPPDSSHLGLLHSLTSTPPFMQGGEGGGVEPPTEFLKRGSLKRPQFLEWGCWERGRWLSSGGGCNFHIKNKPKSEIFNDKKSL